MTAHDERLSIDPLAVRQVGEIDIAVTGNFGRTVDEQRRDDFEAVLGKNPGELPFRRQIRREAGDHFRGLIGVGDGDDVSDRLTVGFDEQPFAGDAFDYRPTDLEYAEQRGLGDKRRVVVVAIALHRRRESFVDEADDRAESAAVRLDGGFVRRRRGEITRPVPGSCLDRRRQLAVDEGVQAVEHLLIERPLPIERLRVFEGGGLSKSQARREKTKDRRKWSHARHGAGQRFLPHLRQSG